MIHEDNRILDALVLWMNSTFGILLRTGYGNTSHQGRARIAVEATARFPVPNFAEESAKIGERANVASRQSNFDRLAELALQPVAYAWIDENRHEIDRIVLEMFDIDSDKTVDAVSQIRRVLLCREPSVHGGNKRILRALGIQT